MKASVVTFAQLPDEELSFLNYLAKTGEVWARPVEVRPSCEPAPVSEFLASHAATLSHGGVLKVFVGLRTDVQKPVINEAGSVDIIGSCLVGYTRGEYYSSGELAQSNLYYYRGSFRGDQFVSKPEGFLRWAGNVLGWVRRHTPASVPVHRCHYQTRATTRVAEAVAKGLKVWY